MSPWHWALVIAVALLLFGAKRLPDAARSLGRSTRILRAELRAPDGPAPDDPAPGDPALGDPAPRDSALGDPAADAVPGPDPDRPAPS